VANDDEHFQIDGTLYLIIFQFSSENTESSQTVVLHLVGSRLNQLFPTDGREAGVL